MTLTNYRGASMPHIHPDGVDLTVVCYIVNDGAVLLAHHIKLNIWVPIGGHVDPGEDSDTALWREIEEECGLTVEIQGSRPSFVQQGTKLLLQPRYMDIHEIHDDITTKHRHQALIYFGKSKNREVVLQPDEHHSLRWFTIRDLRYSDKIKGHVPANVIWYGTQAINEISSL